MTKSEKAKQLANRLLEAQSKLSFSKGDKEDVVQLRKCFSTCKDAIEDLVSELDHFQEMTEIYDPKLSGMVKKFEDSFSQLHSYLTKN